MTAPARLRNGASEWQESLFASLSALRAKAPAERSRSGHHWRVIYQYVRARHPRGPDAEDEIQEVMLAISRRVGSMRADNPVSAAGWIAAIRRHVIVDSIRARGAVRLLPFDDSRMRVAQRDCARRDFVEAVLGTFDAHSAAYVAATVRRPRTAVLRRLEARAALRRVVLGESLGSIRIALGCDASDDLVSKRIERGRAVVIDTVTWLRNIDRDTADLYEVLVELATERRIDARRPRPNRRRDRLAVSVTTH